MSYRLQARFASTSKRLAFITEKYMATGALWMVFCVVAIFLPACSHMPSALQDAVKFLENAPCYQVKETAENRVSHVGWTKEIMVSPGGIFRNKETIDGRISVDLITDGKREFLLNEQGKYEEVHGDAAEAAASLRHGDSFNLWRSTSANVRLTGHENVNGVPASFYKVERAGVRTTFWVADQDHRPLKIHEEMDGTNPRTGKRDVCQISDTTYEYRFDVLITLPE